MENRYDFIATHSPQNKTASLVTQKGVHYNPILKGREHFDVPLPKKSKRKSKNIINQKKFINLSGNIHGTFLVLHLAPKSNCHGALWVCRCRCGQYELRSTKAIKNHRNNPGKFDEDTCLACEDLIKIRNTSTAKSMGYEYNEYMEKFKPRKKNM